MSFERSNLGLVFSKRCIRNTFFWQSNWHWRQIVSFYFYYHYSIIFKNELKPNINQLIRLGLNEPTAFVHVWQPRTQKEVATLATTVSPANQPVVHVTMENRFPRWRHNQLFLAPTRCIKPKLQVWFFNM